MPIDANRTITETIEIDASLEEVWQSLVLGEQIARWFSFEATSEARLGGEVHISWGTSWQGSLQITAFEPECHLQWSEAAKPGSWPPTPLAIDFHLEGSGGKTVLRLVHSGFAAEGWDDELDSISRGWQVFLGTLAHSLERHRGTPRRLVFVEGNYTTSNEDAWRRLVGAEGIGLDLGEGRFELQMATGDHLAGPVQVASPPKDLSGIITAWNDAHLWVECRMGYAKLTLSTYGLPDDEVAAIETRWSAWMTTLFPRKKH